MALIYHGTMDVTANSCVKSVLGVFVLFIEMISHTNVSAEATMMAVFIGFNTNMHSIPPEKQTKSNTLNMRIEAPGW